MEEPEIWNSCYSPATGWGDPKEWYTYETDVYTPMEFFEIAEALTPVIRSTDKRS